MGVLDAGDGAAVGRALRGLSLPGRFQIVPGRVEWILDVAHNPQAAQALAASLAARPCAGRTFAVCGILGDKDIEGIVGALDAQVSRWIACGARSRNSSRTIAKCWSSHIGRGSRRPRSPPHCPPRWAR